MIDWNSQPNEVIVVISDLHSNKRAIRSALESIKQKRVDKLIILGDILTYGIDAQETIEIVLKELEGGADGRVFESVRIPTGWSLGPQRHVQTERAWKL